MKQLTALFLLLIGGTVMTLDAEAFEAGFDLDPDAETQLTEQVDLVNKLMEIEDVQYDLLREQIQSARKVLLPMLKKAKTTETRSWQEAKIPAHLLDPKDTPAVPKNVTVALYAGMTLEGVKASWNEQLLFFASQPQGLLEGENGPVREMVGWPNVKKKNRRALPAAESLRECEKLSLLLGAEEKTATYKKGEELFADNFSKGAGNWQQYGQCVTKNEGDLFRMKDSKPKHPDAQMWTKKTFKGDYVVEFEFTPHTEGTKAGALFTLCATPRPGKTLAVSVGESMNTYSYGIDGYHFSMHRGTTGKGNARRVGPGLKMMASGKDPCPTPGKTYRVALGKVGPQIFLVVDGKLVHAYYDAGTYGPVLDEGHLGIRHWAGLDASYKDFRVFRLVKKRGLKPDT